MTRRGRPAYNPYQDSELQAHGLTTEYAIGNTGARTGTDASSEGGVHPGEQSLTDADLNLTLTSGRSDKEPVYRPTGLVLAAKSAIQQALQRIRS